MKFLPRLLCSIVFLAATAGLFAATAPPPAPSPAPSPAAAPPAPKSKLDYYLDALTVALKLSDDEKKAITSFYQADGAQLQTILNSDSISPLEQDRQVSDLRAARNAKVDALLGSSDRMAAFLKIEARYRVALIEFATGGGLVPPAPPAPAAAPAPAPASSSAPASAAAPAPASSAAPATAAPAPARTPPPE